MFKDFFKIIKDKNLVKEVVNITVGILMAVALLVFFVTGNPYSICAVILLGALMNVLNGLSWIRRKEKKSMGMSMILLGVVILLVFMIYLSNGYLI